MGMENTAGTVLRGMGGSEKMEAGKLGSREVGMMRSCVVGKG